MVLSLRFLCTLSYGFFLCAHEALAFLSEYALWWYVHSRSLFDRVIFYVLIGIYCFTIALKLCALVYRNDLHRGRPPRAVVHPVGGGYKIQLTVQRKLKAKAGSTSICGCHQSVLVLPAGPSLRARLVWGRRLNDSGVIGRSPERIHLEASAACQLRTRRGRAILSGLVHWFPRGQRSLTGSSWLLRDLMSYPQHLIRGHNNFSSRTRRINLVWQLEDTGEFIDLLWWSSSSWWQRTEHPHKNSWKKRWRKMHWMTATYIAMALSSVYDQCL